MTLDITAFRRTSEQKGLVLPENILPGRIVRFPGIGKTNGNKSGWAWLSPDGQAGAYGDWSSDIAGSWHAERSTTMTPAERTAHARRIADVQRIQREEESRGHAEAAQRALAILTQAAPEPAGHRYLQDKHVQPHGVRVDNERRLIVPVMVDGTLSSLQFIDENGAKKFLFGGAVKGGSYTIGELVTAASTVLLCEGFATGASLHEATGLPVVCAFFAGNLTSVAKQLRQQSPSAMLIIAGDHDTSGTGQREAQMAAEAVRGVVLLPQVQGQDWNDVHRQRGLDAVKEAITRAKNTAIEPNQNGSPSENSFLAYRPGGLPETIFRPISAPDLLAEVSEPTDWLLEDYLPEGSLALIAGKPKEGKTTLTYELAVKVVQGAVFLGRATRKGGVLILAVEEHRRDVKARLQNLGADGLDSLYLHIGMLAPTPTFFRALHTFISDHDIKLVIIDTLAAFWSVENENDASEMTKAVKPLLQLARDSGACVLLIHHARKSEGSHGDEIRGSGALFGLVDIAIVMKRHAVETQRLLQAQSRYPETPSELVLELRESGYVALGEPAAVGKADKLKRLQVALTDNPEETEALAKKAGLSRRDASRLLDLLVGEEKAIREGAGKRNDPHRFRRFVSGNPPITRGDRKPETSVSFLATPSTSNPPARNETIDSEVIDVN